MINKSRGGMAHTLVDVGSAVAPLVLQALSDISGLLALRLQPERY